MNTPTEAPFDLRRFLTIVRLRRWWIVTITVVMVTVALLYSLQQTPTYQSVAEVLVRPVNLSPTQPVDTFVRMETERRIATSATTVTKALEKLSEEGVRPAGISVSGSQETETLTFVASSPNPRSARATAQADADAYLESRLEQVLEDLLAASEPLGERLEELNRELTRVQNQLLAADDESERSALQIQLNSLLSQRSFLEQKRNELVLPENLRVGLVLQPALLPRSPSSPNHGRTGILALMAGLALGLGAALLRERLDDRLKGRDDFEIRIGSSVLAVIPRVRNWANLDASRIVVTSDPASEATEAYKTLRTSLLFAASQHGLKTLAVTSAEQGEGKTVTAANLGAAISQSGKRVILVSADLRRPRLHDFLDVDVDAGITEVLLGERRAMDVLEPVGIENLRLLHSGAPPGNPAEILGSSSTSRLLTQLGEVSDLVILDCAPVLAVADTVALAPLVDGILFVADAQKATHGSVAEARHRLDQAGGRVIGAVLNNFDRAKAASYHTPYTYYTPYLHQDGRVAAPEPAHEPATPGPPLGLPGRRP